MIQLRSIGLACAIAALITAPGLCQNPVTYIDADTTMVGGSPTGNTRETNLSAIDPWVVREFGVGGDILQFRGGPDGTEPRELATTVSGLNPGTEYNFFAFFWDTPAGAWFVDASLNGPAAPDSDFTNFLADDVDNVNGPVVEAWSLPFANLADVHTTVESQANPGVFRTINLTAGVTGNDVSLSDNSGSNTDLFAANVGTMVAPASGELEVFIRNVSAGDRVWYDGVGFQEVGGLVGDTNNDGAVDLLDYDEIASRIGGPAVTPGSLGDVFGDGVVDLRDFTVWQQNRTDQIVSIPEPESVSLLLLAGSFILGSFRRRFPIMPR